MAWFVKICFLLGIKLLVVVGDRQANRLLRDLLNHYNIYERPLLNASEQVVVHFGMGLRQLVGLDEKSQTLETIIFFKYTWSDVNLDWEPSEYGGIRELSLPITKIWKPDILLYNSADTPWDRTYPVPAVVYFNGTVHWAPPSYVKSNCDVTVTYFPFDDQHCKFKFGAWTYDLEKLDLRNDSDVVDTTFYMASSDWSLTGTEAIRTVKKYECCPISYVDVTFHIYLRRRTLSYGANLIIPTLVLVLMAILVFTLPSESGEKVALDISVFLSLLFCLQMLADRSPPTSESVPLLGLFFICCSVLVALSIVMSVIVLNLHHSDPDTAEMSDWEKKIFLLWLPKMVGVSRPAIDTRRFSVSRSERLKRPVKRKASTKLHMGASKIPKCEECEEDLLPPCTCGDLIELGQVPLPIAHVIRKMNGQDTEEEYVDEEDEDDQPPPYASIFRGHKLSMREIQNRLRRHVSIEKEPTIPMGSAYKSTVLSKMAGRIDPQMKKITGYVKKTAKDDKTKNDWQFAARAIDRLCLYLFFGLICTITMSFWARAPHIVA